MDPRLGIRLLGGWNPRQLPDIAQTVESQASRVCSALEKLAIGHNITLALPTLPIPPVAFTPGWLSSRLDADLRAVLANLSSRLLELPAIRVISPQRLDHISPCSDRFDPKSELRFGFPYSLNHADKLAGLMAHAITNSVAKKGLITDLDNTLWMGILGEIGPEGIKWDLDRSAQRHSLYQQLLASF